MIYQLKKLQSRAASAENFNAEVSAGGQSGNGRKGSPCIWPFKKGEKHVLLDANGPGMIRHIWCTMPPGNVEHMRNVIIRMYWDDQTNPSVEVPLGDFFGIAHGRQRNMNTEFIGMQGGKGLNCWIQMPFKKRVIITVENDSDTDVPMFFYQVDFTLGDEIDNDTGYLHAQFRRSNPCPIHEDYVLVDGVKGRGVYLGTVLGVRSLFKDAWWGEGEFKFFMDGDDEFPTICGTGAEDYMGSAWGLDEIVTPFQGAPLVDNELGLYSIYRFHAKDPIYFQEKLKITVQQIGYGSREKAQKFFGKEFVEYQAAGTKIGDETCYFDLSDDYSSTVFWYQSLPTAPFPKLPDRKERSANLFESEEKNTVNRNDI
jgi:hypothetical protein